MTDPRCLIVAGPSGVGKSTLIRLALKENPRWRFSVSATTRPMREGEQDGQEYYFLGREEFQRRIVTGQFLEYAEVYGNFYGTPSSELAAAAAEGKSLLIEVDTVGCLSIRALRPEFPMLAILPPSTDELKRRLRDRGTETEETMALRFAQIVAELQRMRGFDFYLVNDDLDMAQREMLRLMAVIESGALNVPPAVDRLLNSAGGIE
jgi:guanylate kinase